MRNFRIASILLKEGAASGLNLYQIAQLAFREDPDEMSHLEKAVQRAEENYEYTNKYIRLNLILPTKVNGKPTRLQTPTPVLLKHASSDQNGMKEEGQHKPQVGLMPINEESEAMDDFKLNDSYQLDEDESPMMPHSK